MSNFTSGPWRIEYETMVMSGNRSVASCGGYSTNVDTEKVRAENIANARLIAAAPLMLEAIEQVTSIIERLAYTGDFVWHLNQWVKNHSRSIIDAAGTTDGQ